MKAASSDLAAGGAVGTRVTSAWSEGTLTTGTAPSLAASPDVSAVSVAVADKNVFKTIDMTGLGLSALDNHTTGANNTAVGEAAGQLNRTGNSNTALRISPQIGTMTETGLPLRAPGPSLAAGTSI